MTLITLVGLVTLVACALAQQPGFPDYDYQDIPVPRPAPVPVRPSGKAAARNYAKSVAAAPPPSKYSSGGHPRPTPVPILKQINKHNNDGSYTYGYEGADGSFKIETKLPSGEVMGKYGYVDDTGKLRVIDYGANRYGFQPAGEGITVAPPTLVDETTDKDGKPLYDYDDEPEIPVQPQPRPQQRQQVFAPRAQPPARTFTAFEEELKSQPQLPPQFAQSAAPAPIASFDNTPARFAAQAAQARFAPQPQAEQARFAPNPQAAAARFATQPQVTPQAVPQARFGPPVGRANHPRFPAPVQPAPVHNIPVPQGAAPVPPRAVVPNAIPAAPIFRPAANPPPRPAPVKERPGPSSGILLDQLAKQFALPDNAGQPLHDISFGAFSSRSTF